MLITITYVLSLVVLHQQINYISDHTPQVSDGCDLCRSRRTAHLQLLSATNLKNNFNLDYMKHHHTMRSVIPLLGNVMITDFHFT